MPISTVNPGFGPNQFTQSALKSALPQHANVTAAPKASASDGIPPNAQAAPESAAATNIGSVNRYANLVGVAAYAAIMNPQASTSMRTEA